MDEPTLELTIATAWPMLAALFIGVGVLFWLFLRHIDGQPLLRFEPRRLVPWTFAGPLLVLAPTLAALLIAAANGFAGSPEAANPPRASDADPSGALSMLVYSGLLIGLSVATCLVLAVMFHAVREDFGLPRGGRRLFADVRLGMIAYFAVWPVVYATLIFVSMFLEDRPSMHSLMKEVLEHPSPVMMVAAALMACVTAPVCEEIAFRLIFQGWLERRAQLSRRSRFAVGPVEPSLPLEPAETGSPESALATPADNADASVPTMTPVDDSIHWGPILTSAALFGVAHFAQGPPAVAAMVCLGISQGYVYQRTHRIVPCIVCHMMFNSVSMLVFFLAQHAAAGH